MERAKFLVFFIISIALLQVNLSALISSRVMGKVMDKATGQPIEGADVVLLFGKYSDLFLSGEVVGTTKSNKRGIFKFDNVEESDEPFSYFLAVFKKEYAHYGPLGYNVTGELNQMRYEGALTNDLEGAVIKNLIPEYDRNLFGMDFFKIKQGEIKYFIINLEKEAILDFKILRKTPKGLDNRIDAQIQIYHNKYLKVFSTGSRTSRLEGLKDGIVAIECYPRGYPKQVYKNIRLEKGKTTTIEKVLDFTSGQVLHGFVKNKNTDKPIHGVNIIFNRIINGKQEYAVESTYTEINGEFWIGGFEPGKYRINFYDLEIEYEEVIEFVYGEQKEIARNF